MFPSAQNSISADAQRHGGDSYEFVAALARAYTLSEIFPLHHPTVLDAMREVEARLDEVKSSVVQVERNGLVADGAPVSDPHGHVREFARDLSQAGVTEIGFGESLPFPHLERLLQSLRVVTEDPTLALATFLSQEGGCDVELGFNGVVRSSVADALATEPLGAASRAVESPALEPGAVEPQDDVSDAVQATSEEIATEPIEPEQFSAPTIHVDEIERSEPVSEWTVEQEIELEQGSGPDLVVEPLGAFLSMPDPAEDLAITEVVAEPTGALPNDTHPDETHSNETQQTETQPRETDPDEADWRTEVRARLLLESQVEPLASTAPEAAPDDASATFAESDSESTDDPGPGEPKSRATAWWEIDPSDPREPESLPDKHEALLDDDATDLAMPMAQELPSVDIPEPTALPELELPNVEEDDADTEDFYSSSLQLDEEAESAEVDSLPPRFAEEEQPLASEPRDAEARAQEWGGPIDPDADHAEISAAQVSPLQELYDSLEAEHDVQVEPEVEPEVELQPASSSNGTSPFGLAAAEHGPVAPVLDESEADSPVLAVPPDTHMAAPEELSVPAASLVTPEAAAPRAQEVKAFHAAFEEDSTDQPEAPMLSKSGPAPEPSEVWETAADEGATSLWDAETTGWTEDTDVAPEGLAADEVEEQFPPVEELAPDGPTLLESPEVEDSAAVEEALDPEVALLEDELAAEESNPEEIQTAPVPDKQPETPVATDATPFPELIARFVGAPETERPAVQQLILLAASNFKNVQDYESIAKGIEALVRDAVPGDHGSIALARTLAEPPVVTALCHLLAEVRDADRRDELVYVFGQLSELTAPALASDLSEVPPRAARRNYMDALFRMRTEAVAVAVPMLDDSRWFIVRNGVDILGEAGDEGAVARLAPSLAHPDHRVRRATVMALAKLGGIRASNELIPVLEDPNAEVREGAALALGHLRSAKALRPLLELLDRDKEDDMQLVILRSLGQIGDPGAVPAIEKRAVGFFFIKPNKAVRIAAYRALTAIGTPHASRLVLDAVNDRDSEVAVAARSMAEQLQGGVLQPVAEPV